jgi:hypothetical protein
MTRALIVDDWVISIDKSMAFEPEMRGRRGEERKGRPGSHGARI